MSPYDRAEALYSESPEVNSFEWYVRHFSRVGYLLATPEYFVMGRPVPRMAAHSQLVDCDALFPHEDCDCWFVHAMAGDIGKAMLAMPWPLPWIGFERERGGQKELQFLPSDSIKRWSLQAPTHEHHASPALATSRVSAQVGWR